MTYYLYKLGKQILHQQFGFSDGEWAKTLNEELYVSSQGKLSFYKVDLFLGTHASFALIIYAMVHLVFFAIKFYSLIHSLVIKLCKNDNKVNDEIEISGNNFTELPNNRPAIKSWHVKWEIGERFQVLKFSLYLVFVQEWLTITLNGLIHQNYNNPLNISNVVTFNLVNWAILICMTYDTLSLIFYNSMLLYPVDKSLSNVLP